MATSVSLYYYSLNNTVPLLCIFFFEGGWDRKCPLTILSLHVSDAFAAFVLVWEACLERRLRSPSDGLHLPAFSTTSSSVMAVLYELHLRAKYTSKGVL